MALVNAATTLGALQTLYAAFVVDKTERGMRTAVNHLSWLTGTLNFLYGAPTNIALTADGDDASVTAFVAAESTMSAKTIFRVTTAIFDFADDALGTARDLVETGTDDDVVAIGDVYVISDAGTAVVYLGNNSGITFDNVGESAADFKSIGS